MLDIESQNVAKIQAAWTFIAVLDILTIHIVTHRENGQFSN